MTNLDRLGGYVDLNGDMIGPSCRKGREGVWEGVVRVLLRLIFFLGVGDER